MVLRVVSRGMVSGRLLARQALPAHEETQNPAAPATETSYLDPSRHHVGGQSGRAAQGAVARISQAKCFV